MSPLPFWEAGLRASKSFQRLSSLDRSGPEEIVHFGGSHREGSRAIVMLLGPGRLGWEKRLESVVE